MFTFGMLDDKDMPKMERERLSTALWIRELNQRFPNLNFRNSDGGFNFGYIGKNDRYYIWTEEVWGDIIPDAPDAFTLAKLNEAGVEKRGLNQSLSSDDLTIISRAKTWQGILADLTKLQNGGAR